MVRTGLTADLGMTRMGAVARPWADICRHFGGVPQSVASQPMAELVRAIAGSEYPAAGLQAATSMADLYLGISAAVFDNPHLIISAAEGGDGFVFTYNDGSKVPWSRRVRRAEAFEVLQR